MFPHGETAELLRGAEVEDPYSGETILDWDNPEVVETWHGIGIAPRATNEDIAVGRETVHSGLTLYAVPSNSTVHAHDRVKALGQVWEVDGEPARFKNPMTGWNPGLTVYLKKEDG